ncbi:MAG TPA: hypothetical protein VGO52_19350 [Hyphomonadaceae bacterium]|jgi:hypothetical protein|nr:hypothetical protein [Hyphomonadaceae bacterium]
MTKATATDVREAAVGISGLHEFTFARDDIDRVVALVSLDAPFEQDDFLLLLENIKGDVTRENFYELRDVLATPEKEHPALLGIRQMLPCEGLIGYWGFSVKPPQQLEALLEKTSKVDQRKLEIAAELAFMNTFSLFEQSARIEAAQGAARALVHTFRTLESNFAAVSARRGHASLVF